MIVDFQVDIFLSFSEKQKVFAVFLFRVSKIVKSTFFSVKIFQFWPALHFPWGHVSNHKKLGPQSVYQLNVNWIQLTYKETNKQAKYMHRRTTVLYLEHALFDFVCAVIRIFLFEFNWLEFKLSIQFFSNIAILWGRVARRQLRNWVFVTNADFLIPIFFPPDGVNLWYFKLRFFI